MAHDPPRYLRFARALALVSGIAAPLSSGCALQHGVTPDTGRVADAGTDAPSVDPCSTCDCVFGSDGVPDPPNSCAAMGLYSCCYAVGPLSPPELPA